MIVVKRGCKVYDGRVKLDEVGKRTWKECGSIARKIKKEIENTFPEAEGKLYTQSFGTMNVKLYCVSFKYSGLSVCLTIQYKGSLERDKPFVYLDGINVSEECRGMGLSTKFLDCMQRAVDKKIFKYLNFKDWSEGYWGHVKPRYSFLRCKYADGWLQG